MHLILMPIHLFPRWTGSGLSFKKRMIMQVKLISLLLFIGCLQVSARGYGQQVTINVHETSIIEVRSEEHTSELQSLMRISYAVFCLKKKNMKTKDNNYIHK